MLPSDGVRPSASYALAKRLGPYLVALAAVSWVVHKINLHELWTTLGRANIPLFIGLSAVMLLANCAADTFAMTSVFRWFGIAVPYRELFVVRASTYLLAILNYHVGQAAIVGYLVRAQRVPFLRATGCIFFIIGINVGTLFLLASVGARNASGELQVLRLVPIVCTVGVGAYAALLWWKPRALAEQRLLAPLFEMGIDGHVKGVLVRLPHVAVLLVWHFASLRMFGVKVPPLEALLYLPAYFAVGALPVNVNGFGVAQVVALKFFSPFAAGGASAQQAAVFAYTMATSGISILLQLVLGFSFLRRATALGLPDEKALEKMESEAALEPAQPEY
jgi:hypothetical protein